MATATKSKPAAKPKPKPAAKEAIPKEQEQLKATTPDDDLFKLDADADMAAFIDHMKTPKEKIEMPSVDFNTGDATDDAVETPSGGTSNPDDQQTLAHLNYNQEQEWWADFVLLQVDKIMAFGGHMVTKESPARYRMRTGPASKDDHEVMLLAAIINKYQMKFSLEFAFASAILMKYGMMYTTKVVPDLQAKRAKAETQKKQTEQREKTA